MDFISSIMATVGHLYPLKSGFCRFANSAMFRHLDPPNGPDAIAKVTGRRALVPGGDHVGRAMRFVGDLDPKVSWIVDRAILPGDVALDIGANLGLVSLRMAARTGLKGQVHAFEPQPRLHPYLNQTIAMNPACPITLHPIALGREQAVLTMSVPAHNAGAASLLARPDMLPDPNITQIDVPVHRLDDYADHIGLERINFIKIDVEGFEFQVFSGAQSLLERTRPHVIILEENQIDPATGLSDALRLLQDLGYDLYALPRRLFSVTLHPAAQAQEAHDFVAVSKDAPKDLRARLRL